MSVVVDHQHRAPVAGSQAADRQQREAAIGRGLAETDAELLANLLPDLLVTGEEARHAIADLDDVSTDRPVEDQVVESGDAFDVGCRNPELTADRGNGGVRYPAV